ncbi:head-tail connector protein, partial [Clostridium tarantellae]
MLKELKEYLNITFEDKDSILNGFLESGKIYLNNIAGVSLEFNTNSYNK